MVAALAAITYLVSIGLYARLLQLQGDIRNPGSPVAPVFLLLGGLAVCCLVAAFAPWRRVRLTLLSGSAAGGLVLGVLAGFSIGVLVLVGAFLSGLAYVHSLVRPGSLAGWQGDGIASVGGTMGAIAALAAVFVPSMSPHVDCLPGGASFSSGWGLFSGGSSSGTVSGTLGSRTITGSGTDNGHAYRFTCRDGKLVDFTYAR